LTKSKPAPQSSKTVRLFARVSKPLADRDPSSLPPRGHAEAEAAVRWYNARVPGLGDDFRVELIAAVEWIVEGPEVWPVSVDDLRARRYLLSRFPYSIVYVVAVDGGITVAAVAHTKRKPGYWLRRV